MLDGQVFQDQEGLRLFMQELVNQVMQSEQASHLGASRYERNEERRGHRNGTKPRTLKTRVGELNLEQPQTRGCEPYHPSLFARWQRSERALLIGCA